jgi:hypothetical protein
MSIVNAGELLQRLAGAKVHRRPARRLSNRFRISRIVLLALDEGLECWV